MPTVVQLRPESLSGADWMAGLSALVATHEVVLVGAYDVMPQGRVSALRRALAPRSMVALLVDDHLPAVERVLVRELLSEGTIPVIITACDPPPAVLTAWLDPARRPARAVPPWRLARRPMW